MSERLARVATMLVLGLLAAAALSCAHLPPRPPLWDICRDACAAQGGTHAAIVGSTNPATKPGCMCAATEREPGT